MPWGAGYLGVFGRNSNMNQAVAVVAVLAGPLGLEIDQTMFLFCTEQLAGGNLLGHVQMLR